MNPVGTLELVKQESLENTFKNATVANLPEYCAKTVVFLQNQPLFGGTSQVTKSKFKAIPLGFDIAKIISLFDRIAFPTPIEDRDYTVFAFKKFDIKDKKGDWLTEGLILIGKNRVSFLPEKVLESEYAQVLKKISSGWVKAKLKENPDIMNKQNPDQFELFIKKAVLIEEDTFIRFLIHHFSFFKDATCDDTWLKHPGFRFGDTYIWIRRSKLNDFIRQFGFPHT